jgi:carboxyl-terminal processing protease
MAFRPPSWPPNDMRRHWLGLAAISAVSFAGGGLGARYAAASRVGERQRDAHLLQRTVATIRRNYVDSIPADSLYLEATRGLVRSLHDPYAELLLADAYRRFNQQMSGTRIELAPSAPREGGALPLDAPLFAEGTLAPGDRILAIEGRSTIGLTDAQAASLLARDTSSIVTILVRPDGNATPVLRRVSRTAVHVSAVTPGVLLRSGVGYIALHSVTQASARELRDQVNALRARGMHSLILDLRRNPGGLIAQGVEIASLFLEDGDTVAVMRGRASAPSKVHLSVGGQAWDGMPLALLVNPQTASSAEVIAAALQDHDRALVVGTPTYGKGVIQTTFPLGSDVAVKFTTARWYAPSGRSIQRMDSTRTAPAGHYRTTGGRPVPAGRGVTPDIAIRPRPPAATDVAFVRQARQAASAYRAALGHTADAIAASGQPADADFVVTPAMRMEFWAALEARDVPIRREVFEDAAGLVDRELGYAIARERWGESAEIRRRTANDRVVQAALALMGRASDQPSLIAVATDPLAAR